MRDPQCITLEEAEWLYDKVRRAISVFLNYKPAPGDVPFKLDPVCVIAIPQGERSGGPWEWTLRPQFVEAMQIAKL